MTLLLVAPDDGAFVSREQAEMLLARDHFPAPGDVLDELVAATLLDAVADGPVAFHDWAEHQPLYRGPSDEAGAKSVRNHEDYLIRRAKPSAVEEGQRLSATFSDRGDEKKTERSSNKESLALSAEPKGGSSRSEAPTDYLSFFLRNGLTISKKQRGVLDRVVDDDGGAGRLMRLLEANAGADDVFGATLDALNDERATARARAAAEDTEQAARAATARARPSAVPPVPAHDNWP